MRITVSSPLSEARVEVSEFDITKTILMKVSRAVPKTTDRFFIFANSEYRVEEGVEIESYDLRDDVSRTLDPAKLRAVAIRYGVPYKWVLSLWFEAKDPAKNPEETEESFDAVIKTFRTLGTTTFSSPQAVRAEIVRYYAEVELARKSFLEELASYEEAYEVLGTYPSGSEPGGIEVEGGESTYQAILSSKKELIEVFDAVVPSEKIPFAMCKVEGKTYYKVYAEAFIPEVWQREVYETDGVYFKIQLKKSSRIKFIERAHASVGWSAGGEVRVQYQLPSSSEVKAIVEEALYEVFKEHFSGELTLPLVSYGPEKQLSIKCTFTTKLAYSSYCLAHLIHTDPGMSKFVFMNETVKPEPGKPRFQIFFNPHSTDLQPSSVFQITTEENFPGSIKVRIGRCKDYPSALALRAAFVKLMGRYAEGLLKAQAYFKIFKSPKVATGKISAKKINRKAGNRLLLLQEADPNMFGNRFGDQVQKNYQPYIVAPDEVEELTRTLGPHKLMRFEGVTYACQEPGETREFMFPGLKLNNDTKSGNPRYKEDYPLLPRCVSKDQYEIQDSLLNSYLRGGIEEALRVAGRDKQASYVIESTRKLVSAGREGVLYPALRKLAANLDPEASYLRKGVDHGPDSIFHAFVSVVDPAYDASQPQKRAAKVKAAKEKFLADRGVIFSAKQETYDYYLANYESELNHPDRYLAPEVWVSALEVLYGIEVVLLVVDEDHPEGDFMTRRATRAHLPRAYGNLKRAVIIAAENRGGKYPYQCEVLVRADGTDRTCLFDNDPVANQLAKFAHQAGKVYVVSPSPEGEVLEYPRVVF